MLWILCYINPKSPELQKKDADAQYSDMLTASICIASSGHKAVQSCQEVAILSTVLAHAHLHCNTSTSLCPAGHVTDGNTTISMLQLTALWQRISRHVFDDDNSA